MWKNIILFLSTFGLMQHRLSSVPIDCARRVQTCPVGKEKWEEKNDQLLCATNYRYVCLRDSNGYLLETCMVNFPVRAHSSNCPILYACKKNEAYLGPDSEYYHCPEEVPGCPPKNHPEYSIHELYKYPKCIQSNLSAENGNTSPRSTSMSMTTISTGHGSGQENKHIAIVIVVSALLLTTIGCFIGYVVYSRRKKHGYSEVKHQEGYQDLRCWIQSINETEADRIRILPLKEDDTIEVDRIYVPLSIDEKGTRTTSDRPIISGFTPDKMFYTAQDKLARFVFMLGDAGYGKTVQCRSIAKSWCKAWKAETAQGNGTHVLNLEYTKSGTLNEWVKSLKDFEFLFYVPMRDVNNGTLSVKDMIYDYYRRFDISQEHLDDILAVLKDKRYKCLIILDGLDEWNISESAKKNLLNKGIPNCEETFSCTYLITMRSWRFMEVDPKCRQESFDKVFRLHGLDNNSIEKLTTNMLCNYFNIERESRAFLEQSENIKKIASSLSPELESLMKIPMLAVFFILMWHENIQTGHSLTTFYLSMIEALMKRSFKREQIRPKIRDKSELSVIGILKNFFYVSNHMPEISQLGKIAFEDDLDSQNASFVLNDVNLRDHKVKETVDFFLHIGLLNKRDTSGQIHEDNVRFSFLHKTIQEFLYTLYLVHDRSEAAIVNFFINNVSNIEKALELSTVLTFVSGLSPALGCKISSHIAELSSDDEDICRFRDRFPGETYHKVFKVFNFQLSCYREVRGLKSIKDFKYNGLIFSLSDVILLGNDMDRLTIRESADVLRYHANDIISLCMKCVPNDSVEGITNIELTDFLQESQSLVSLCIDGYDRGKCRLFDDSCTKLPRLRTLGLFNVAFADNILTDFLTKDESKRSMNALGLFFIKSNDDLDVDFQYQFASVQRVRSTRSSYVQKRKTFPSSEMSRRQMKEMEYKPLLKCILEVLPTYDRLATLHVSYMDSEVDRKMLLCVLPQIKTLTNLGYNGTSINQTPDYTFDTTVIKVLLKIEQLQMVFLSEIILKENVLNFENLSKLERIRLEVFDMNISDWSTFVSSVFKIKSLDKVLLNDTNIDNESYEKLMSCSSCYVVKDEITKW